MAHLSWNSKEWWPSHTHTMIEVKFLIKINRVILNVRLTKIKIKILSPTKKKNHNTQITLLHNSLILLLLIDHDHHRYFSIVFFSILKLFKHAHTHTHTHAPFLFDFSIKFNLWLIDWLIDLEKKLFTNGLFFFFCFVFETFFFVCFYFFFSNWLIHQIMITMIRLNWIIDLSWIYCWFPSYMIIINIVKLKMKRKINLFKDLYLSIPI